MTKAFHFQFLAVISVVFGAWGCADDETTGPTPNPPKWECKLAEGSDPDSAPTLGCQGDYDILSSEPTDSSIPGATSVKTVIDRADENALYFQNSKRYCIHWDFASTHLSGDGRPIVPELSQFNTTEYYSPDRRFLLGALSFYAGPKKWVYEISPYDTADAKMIETAFRKLKENLWIGEELSFHPTSVTIEAVAKELPADIPITSTDALYDGVNYQPLNPGTSTGILRFHTADEVDGKYTPFREVVVLDAVPNDISIVAGLITAQFQTPLAHINVLSVNRGTPNMALRDAQALPELKALEGKWVELTVGPFDWSVKEISQAEADKWWEAHKPTPITVQKMNLAVSDLREASAMIDPEAKLGEAIATAIPIFGAKATNYGALAKAQLDGAFAGLPAEDAPGPIQPGFGIPMFYYDQFMKDNGLYARLDEIRNDPKFKDPTLRGEALLAFKVEMRSKPMRPEVVTAIVARAAELFPGEIIRFRSSTNSEDLGRFTGAGLYDSESGDPKVVPSGATDSVEWAVKKVWSNVWNPRAYEEREFYSMNHIDVGMGLLVHANFPVEEAQGVAITNNPFDTSGLEPAFYVNGQIGNNDVVTPDPGVLPDAYLHYYYSPGQPIVYIQHSTLVAEGETVIDAKESYRLGVALDAIHLYFQSAYLRPDEFYALEVDWKFDDKLTPGKPRLFIKQARPYPGWKTETSVACSAP